MRTRKDDVTEKLLDASIKLFLEKGFSGSSTNELVDLAGVSKGTLYWHFENKNDILHKILDKYCEEFIEGIRRTVSVCDDDFPAKFKLFYKFMAEFARDKKELLLVFIALLIEFAGTGNDTEKRLKEINDQLNVIIQNLIEEGIKGGTVREEIDSVIYSRFITGALMGSHLQWFLYLAAHEEDPDYSRKHGIVQRDELLNILVDRHR